MAHFSLIHRGFINSVLQKEDQANLPPTVRPRCSLKVASERPINQCSFNLSDRNKKKSQVHFPSYTQMQSLEDTAFSLNVFYIHALLFVYLRMQLLSPS